MRRRQPKICQLKHVLNTVYIIKYKLLIKTYIGNNIVTSTDVPVMKFCNNTEAMFKFVTLKYKIIKLMFILDKENPSK